MRTALDFEYSKSCSSNVTVFFVQLSKIRLGKTFQKIQNIRFLNLLSHNIHMLVVRLGFTIQSINK